MKVRKEIFRSVVSFENLYEISNFGRVRSLGNGNSNSCRERILKFSKDSSGYFYVDLWRDGKVKFFKVARLVAVVFILNPDNLAQVNHINSIKTDNRSENLEWCNQRYNRNHYQKTQNGTSKYPGVSWHKRQRKWVAQISTNGENHHLGYFKNETDAAKAYRKVVDQLKSEGGNYASKESGKSRKDSLGEV